MNRRDLIKTSWRLMKPLNLTGRIHQLIRAVLMPFDRVMDFVPTDGVILDLGCGHGQFLALVKDQYSKADIRGIDLSKDKVASSKQVLASFQIEDSAVSQAGISDLEGQKLDCIVILDVLYLVPFEQWEPILKKCRQILADNGILLMKEMDRTMKWKFALLYLQETIAVKVLGLTLGREFTFPHPEEIRKVIEKAGFSVQAFALDKGYYIPHKLWRCTKDTP